MRLRNVADAEDRLEQYQNFITDPEGLMGKWHTFFGNDQEIHIEIGSGKGRFITTLAQLNPNINYIAIEKFPTVLLKLVKKIPEQGLPNLAIMSVDAEFLEKYLAVDEVSKIYLNFSDPWPKKRHAKRRLTSINFLNLYKKVLKDGGILEFKTDNREFFDFSLEEFKGSSFEILDYTFDLYNSPMVEGNVATEYEERFHKIGTPINKLVARLKKGEV